MNRESAPSAWETAAGIVPLAMFPYGKEETMNNRTLIALAGVLGLGEFVSAAIIWKENYPDAQPLFAVVFGVLFLIGMALVRSGRVVGGAIFIGLLCLFELITFPTWTRRVALDWAYQVSYGALALLGLAAVIAVLDKLQATDRTQAALRARG
ncbi:MAG: hypothetical protein ABJB98_04725, partial [Actinomycetota bacterium]